MTRRILHLADTFRSGDRVTVEYVHRPGRKVVPAPQHWWDPDPSLGSSNGYPIDVVVGDARLVQTSAYGWAMYVDVTASWEGQSAEAIRFAIVTRHLSYGTIGGSPAGDLIGNTHPDMRQVGVSGDATSGSWMRTLNLAGYVTTGDPLAAEWPEIEVVGALFSANQNEGSSLSNWKLPQNWGVDDGSGRSDSYPILGTSYGPTSRFWLGEQLATTLRNGDGSVPEPTSSHHHLPYKEMTGQGKVLTL